jgi:hypothetical protein
MVKSEIGQFYLFDALDKNSQPSGKRVLLVSFTATLNAFSELQNASTADVLTGTGEFCKRLICQAFPLPQNRLQPFQICRSQNLSMFGTSPDWRIEARAGPISPKKRERRLIRSRMSLLFVLAPRLRPDVQASTRINTERRKCR